MVFRATIYHTHTMLGIVMHDWPKTEIPQVPREFAQTGETIYTNGSGSFKIKRISMLELDLGHLFLPGTTDMNNNSPFVGSIVYWNNLQIKIWLEEYRTAYLTLNKEHPVIVDLCDPKLIVGSVFEMETIE